MLLIAAILFQTVQRVSPKSASHYGKFGCLCWQISKNLQFSIHAISVLGLVSFYGIFKTLWKLIGYRNYMHNYPNQDLVVYLMALNYISLISIVKHIKENSNQKIIYTFYGILKNTLQSLGGLENTKSR